MYNRHERSVAAAAAAMPAVGAQPNAAVLAVQTQAPSRSAWSRYVHGYDRRGATSKRSLTKYGLLKGGSECEGYIRACREGRRGME
jgi:hypothetical protein